MEKPVPRQSWLRTESEPDGSYDEAGWGSNYKHRKWVACIGEDLLKKLIDEQTLDWCGCETMGSLGVPTPGDDMCLGCLPAIGFDHNADDWSLSAYITPYVCKKDGETPLREGGMTDRDWERIYDAFLERYAERYRHVEGPYTKARKRRLMRESQEKSKDMVFTCRD